MVCGGNGDMPHIGRKERKPRLHVFTIDVTLPEGIHGKGMAYVMDARWSSFVGKYLKGCTKEVPVPGKAGSRVASSFETAKPVPDERGVRLHGKPFSIAHGEIGYKFRTNGG